MKVGDPPVVLGFEALARSRSWVLGHGVSSRRTGLHLPSPRRPIVSETPYTADKLIKVSKDLPLAEVPLQNDPERDDRPNISSLHRTP